MEHAKTNKSFVPLGEIAKDLAVYDWIFHRWISMYILWCGHRLLDVIHGVQLGYYGIFKASALITMNAGHDTIYIEPFLNLNLGNGKCLLVAGDEGLTELSEDISQYQDVFFTIPWWYHPFFYLTSC